MWVKSEYAGELAVLSTWLAMLLPWNVSFRPVGQFGDMLFVYFPLFQVQYTWLNIEATFTQSGIRVGNGIWLADPVSAALFYQGGSSALANVVWVGAALAFFLALLLSLATYLREERLERGPVDPVRGMGLLLALGALGSLVSTALFWQYSPGVHVPVGGIVVLVLAGTLLTVDRTEATDAPIDEEGDAESA